MAITDIYGTIKPAIYKNRSTRILYADDVRVLGLRTLEGAFLPFWVIYTPDRDVCC